jgi:hypothetical protein
MSEEQEEKPSYYAIITADVRYDERLSPSEKLMWGEFTCLTNKYGFSTASNNYFAKLYNKDPSTISKWVKHLEECGYITVDYERNGKQIISRIIRMTHAGSIEKFHNGIENLQWGVLKKSQGGIEKNAKRILQDNNNTSLNNTYGESTKRFVPPTVDEVKAYCLERNNNIDAQYFCDYYESKGWMVGKNKMKDWKCAIRTWEKNNFNTSRSATFVNNKRPALANQVTEEDINF